VALSLGFPPPGITWHCVFVEPGLSSLKKIKAISHLSGNLEFITKFLIIKKKLRYYQEKIKVYFTLNFD